MKLRGIVLCLLATQSACGDEVVGYAAQGSGSGSGSGSGGESGTMSATLPVVGSESGLATESGDVSVLPDFVAMGFYEGLAVSFDDGLSWQTVQDPPPATAEPRREDLTRGPDKVVVVGGYATLVTENGVDWTSFGDVSLGYARATAYGNGVYVSVGLDRLSWSDDAFGWVDARNGDQGFDYFAVAFGGGIFVAVGNGSMAVSSDGRSWTHTTMGTAKLYTIAYGNERFVAAGETGEIAVTQDGVTLVSTTVLGRGINVLCFFEGEFLGVGGEAVQVSPLGDTWKEFAVPGAEGLGCGPDSLVTFGGTELLHGSDILSMSPAGSLAGEIYRVQYTGPGG